jgi:hypothetical protein
MAEDFDDDDVDVNRRSIWIETAHFGDMHVITF